MRRAYRRSEDVIEDYRILTARGLSRAQIATRLGYKNDKSLSQVLTRYNRRLRRATCSSS